MTPASKEIKQQFERFIAAWQSRDTACLSRIIDPDLRAWLSTSRFLRDGAQHGLFGIRSWIDSFPRTDSLQTDVTNWICRSAGSQARQYAEVACLAGNQSGEHFAFVAAFANRWVCTPGQGWRMKELRMDVTPIGGKLRPAFEQVWLFEPELAILSGSVHLPCIFPELDSPYLLEAEGEAHSAEEEIADCITEYFFGVDQLQFLHVKHCLSDRFAGGKQAFIAARKFRRQRLRSHCSPYFIRALTLRGDAAEAELRSVLSAFPPLCFRLARQAQSWQIVSIEEVPHAET